MPEVVKNIQTIYIEDDSDCNNSVKSSIDTIDLVSSENSSTTKDESIKFNAVRGENNRESFCCSTPISGFCFNSFGLTTIQDAEDSQKHSDFGKIPELISKADTSTKTLIGESLIQQLANLRICSPDIKCDARNTPAEEVTEGSLYQHVANLQICSRTLKGDDGTNKENRIEEKHTMDVFECKTKKNPEGCVEVDNLNKEGSSHKRRPSQRIFSNRLLHLSKIKFYGFDMDYTLAVYKSPIFENLITKLVLNKLVQMGYPEEILSFQYDPDFPVRGLWFDRTYGNLLKVDSNYNILICVHGFRYLSLSEIDELYPNNYTPFSSERYYVYDSLFHLAEIYMIAALIDFFCRNQDYHVERTGVTSGDDVFISYEAIFKDVRTSTNDVHHEPELKQILCENFAEYVNYTPELHVLLERIKKYGAKTFLLTNSDYSYTNNLMTYLLRDARNENDWTSYFDYIVVDANKPLFFSEGSPLKKVNTVTRQKSMGCFRGPLEKYTVYSGGSCQVFSKFIGAHGKDVLYVGDHIYGDIIRSKKQRAWRTFLIIPELEQELKIFHEKRNILNRVEFLYNLISSELRYLDIFANHNPDLTQIKSKISDAILEMERQYGVLGSLFRRGGRQTHFSAQVTRFADIYASSPLKLLHYPLFYLFRGSQMLMPHESTVNPNDPYDESTPFSVRAYSISAHDPIGLLRQPSVITGTQEELDFEESPMEEKMILVPGN